MKRTKKQIRRRPARRATKSRAGARAKRLLNRNKNAVTKLAERASFALNRLVKAL